METVIDSLVTFTPDAGPSQHVAWKRSIRVLQREVVQTIAGEPTAGDYWTLLEYELPRERGRRPDVVALENGVVVVLEFKDKAGPDQADVDQVSAYARDLRHYHEASHGLEVLPVLVPTKFLGSRRHIGDVELCPPDEVHRLLLEHTRRQLGQTIDGRAWLEAPYAPLPGLVEAARMLYHGEALPRIKRAESAKIPEVVEYLVQVAHDAAREKRRVLVLLCGVPGAGKTLVGLQLAHDCRLDDLRSGLKRGAPAVFLSGNAPLVAVLQDALKNTVFVSGVMKYREYYRYKRPNLVPSEHVLIFDEAQRAWDADQMREKHDDAISEPSAILDLGEKVPDWCMVLALVGSGQEIHKGEEAGVGGWLEAVRERPSWKVVGPPGLGVESQPLLELSTTLRSHLAARIHEWVNCLLSVPATPTTPLVTLAEELAAAGFPIYVTDSLPLARRYARDRYEGQSEKRYGLLTSRYAKNVLADGIDNRPHLFDRKKRLVVEKWFNAPTDDPKSCCALERPATEFECQGLELDFPIVCWGDDLTWKDAGWQAIDRRRTRLSDPRRVKLNAYRVLLTRGRDGMCIYAPESVRAVYTLLANSGARILEPLLTSTRAATSYPSN